MRLIVLAAGQGFKLDGFHKLLIRDPRSNETIIERYLRLFPEHEVTVVVGYNAIGVMSRYPKLVYVYNDQWRITGNSYSLALALDERPCIILSADLLFDEGLVQAIREAPANAVFTLDAENKGINTVRCKVADARVQSLYLGAEYKHDPEAVGIYKITDAGVLREWKKNCLANRNVFAGLNLPLQQAPIAAVGLGNFFFAEINTPLDYVRLLSRLGAQR